MDVREKLVELLTEYFCGDPAYYGVEAHHFADHLISSGVTVQEWISVKDRLPEDYKQRAMVICIDHSKPKTNADRIRSMTDDELNDLFHDIYNAGVDDASSYEWGHRKNSFEWTMEWLQQPAEEW